MNSALYHARVMHHRVRPFKHRFVYRVFSLLLDVDEIDDLARRAWLFSRNRFNVLSFHDRDFGPGDGTRPRDWVEQVLKENGHDFSAGRIRLLCFPRLWGYVFNPLSIYYIEDRAGILRAVLYEVTNTYRDRHSYLLPVENGGATIRQNCGKNLYVSPFIGMNGHYHFRLGVPGGDLRVAIRTEEDGDNVLFAAMQGRRKPLTSRGLLTSVLAHPLMTLKVTAGIHWEALKLWRKGAPLFARGQPPKAAVSGPLSMQGWEVCDDRKDIVDEIVPKIAAE